MRRLTTAQNVQLDGYLTKLSDFDITLSNLAYKFAQEEEPWSEILDVQGKVNNLLPEITEFCKDISQQMETYQKEKSDRWQQSSLGLDYEDWRRDWANAAVLINKLDLEEPGFRTTFSYFGIPAFEILTDLSSKRKLQV